MKRRTFTQRIPALALATPILSISSQPSIVKPKKLKKGDTIGLITPGSSISEEGVEKGITNMEQLGLKVKLGKHVDKVNGSTAGTDEQRLEDLHRMFEDENVDAIWCLRGGYGCTRLLPYINYDLIKSNPKVFIGYSDITALLQAFFQKTGLITFHAPTAASTFTKYVEQEIKKVLFKGKATWKIKSAKANLKKAEEEEAFQLEVLQSGKVSGQLAGGNLSLLSAMAGTDFALDATDKLLFLEDVGEKPYRVDRMLTQLRQSANLDQAKGIVSGIWSDCEASPNARSLTLMETLQDRLLDLNIPILHGVSFGHIENQCVLPVGVEAELDTEKQILTLLESAVS